MENINTVAHQFLASYLNGDSIGVDATMGNGNDTLFLAQHCKQVYSFDIQKQALENTKKRLVGYPNVQLYLLGHESMDQVISKPVDCILFNFGYLPHSDETITTLPDTSIQALQLALELLKVQGGMTLACYRGHPGGELEAQQIQAFLLLYKDYLQIHVQSFGNEPDCPILYCIHKLKAIKV